MIQAMSSTSPLQSHPMAFKLSQRTALPQAVRFGSTQGPSPLVQSEQFSGFRALLTSLGSAVAAGLLFIGLGGLGVLPKPLQTAAQPYVDKVEDTALTVLGQPTPFRIAPNSSASMPALKEPGFLLIDEETYVPIAKRNANGSYTLPSGDIAIKAVGGDPDSDTYTLGGLTVTLGDPWVVASGRTYMLADETLVTYSNNTGAALYTSADGTQTFRLRTGRTGTFDKEANTITWEDGSVTQMGEK